MSYGYKAGEGVLESVYRRIVHAHWQLDLTLLFHHIVRMQLCLREGYKAVDTSDNHGGIGYMAVNV